MNKHEQLIHKVAEEMAIAQRAKVPTLTNWEYLNAHTKNWEIEYAIDIARIAVKHMADEVSKVLYQVESDGRVVDQWLLERGLIPPIEEQAKVEPENWKL